MKRSLLVGLALAFVFVSAAEAKGPFQAQGRISDVQRHGEAITFRFAGNIQFSYATAPAGNPAAASKGLEFSAINVPVQLREWTKALKPTEKADAGEADVVFAKLQQMAQSGHVIRLSIDNPGFSFSNRGDLVRVSGTYVYAHDPAQPNQ